ncbi:hypothetical protein ABKN59_005089 [Abortiporus biennis]
MSFKAIVYAYILGGITFIPLILVALVFYTIYTAVPIGDLDPTKLARAQLQNKPEEEFEDDENAPEVTVTTPPFIDVNDLPKPRKGWLTVRRTFEEIVTDGSYVGFVRGFLDARSKDPKRSRPKDMWFVVLKGKVLYLYEDEAMTECDAAIELGGHDVVIYPEGLPDGELFAKRNAICLKPRLSKADKEMLSVTKEMKYNSEVEESVAEASSDPNKSQKTKEKILEAEKKREEAREEALDVSTPWFIFVRSNVEMEDWYLALVHASDHPPNTSTLSPLQPVFHPAHMSHLVATLDEQPDVIPMRWLNAILGRLFFSYYRTQVLESYIIGRLMKKLSKVKRPGFLTHVVVKEVSVGDKAPTLSKPMLKELTKEGDAALEVHLHYKGEIRITVEATATINLGARFKPYAVKLVLAAVLREIEGNLLVKVKRPPSNRLWYAFTQMPRMVLDVEPVVSDRQITWGMILSTIESRLKEVIQESVVLPNMDDIAFFESSKYLRRGGIWADASRDEKPSSSYPETSGPSDDDNKSTASEPAPDTNIPSVSTPTPPTSEQPPVQRSHSADIPQPESSLSNLSTPVRAATATGAEGVNGSVKRRTWLAGARSDESDVFGGDQVLGDFGGDAYDRGRADGPSQRMGRRSSSNRSSPEDHGFGGNASETPQEDTTHLAPIPIPRASSRRSSSTSQDGSIYSTYDNSSTSAPSESQMATYRERSSSLTGSQKNVPSSPTFFQTLKTRDKQAISNSAKEAMRKWGVNWGGLRRESGGNTSNEEAVAEPEHNSPEEQKVHKPRPSYAEVRAAVQQRKGKDRVGSGSDPFSDSESSKPEQKHVTDSGLHASPEGSSSSTVNSTPSPPPHLESDGQNPELRPRSTSPLPPTRTSSRRSYTGMEPGLTLPEDIEHPSVPIHTQPPPPKTMTIPGIHASHRGEVMSMGYAPPPSTEPKKAPAIQSVYRLWKTPSTPGQQTPLQSVNDQNTNASSSSSNPTEPPTLPSRPSPVPPPLPPRSNATHVHVKVESPPDTDGTSSPASAALQSVVVKDRNKRASLEPLASPPQVYNPAEDVSAPMNNGFVSSNPVDMTRETVNAVPNSTTTTTIGAKPPLPPRRSQAASS